VIARAVEVNAGIWANALNITTGTNQINVTSNGDITSIGAISANPTLPDGGANPTPNFAIDVAALGGMYAGKISMVGTEAGLGVRNAGSIGASAGEISITADGLLQNTGKLSAKTNIQLETVALAGNGSIKADANISINLDADYTHTGELQAGGNLSLQTSGDITNQSTLLASQSLNLNAQNINNTATGEIIGADTELNAADTLTNRGLIDGVNTHINANTLTNTQTGSLFGDHVSIKVAHLSNTAGATIAARTQLDIGATAIENRSNGLMFSAGDLAIGGYLDSQRAAMGTADSLTNEHGIIEALEDAYLAVDDLQNLNAGL
jgi:filamentous hemagglutinin